MSAVFLSASIPRLGRAGFETADPFLIREAVAAFVEVVLGRRLIVWGGHPAITPMIWAAATAMGLEYRHNVRLFQSLFFRDEFPEDNHKYGNVTYIEKIADNKDESIDLMRRRMLQSENFEAAVFVGGMEGIWSEFRIFSQLWPDAKTIALPSPGGTSREVFRDVGKYAGIEHAIDFSAWLYELLEISPRERRVSVIEGRH